jgi:lipopolysaccharide transport system permease protein
MSKLVIDADKKSLGLNLRELFQYKDLFFVLSYRDLRVRYAQTFLGLLWAFIQPVTSLLVFTLVFGKFVKVNTAPIPYPLFALSGLVVWTYFSFVLSNAGSSIIDAQQMVKKIYFPRLVIPLSKAVVGLVDFFISFAFLIVLMVWYQYMPPINIIFLPVFIILAIIASLAAGIWLCALTIRFRDFKYVVPFMVQFGLYATPIAYPTSLIQGNLKFFFYANPLTGIIEGFRWCLLGGEPPHLYSFISVGVMLVLFVSGLFYFKKVEKIIADIV